MPDKKPTDAEIKKALECCLEASGVNCGKCPYCDNCVTDENTSLMMIDVLDLLNRLQADRENYKQIAENQQRIILDKAFEKKKLKAEIERLTKSVTTLTKSISELTDEVERQKKAKDESFLFAANILESEKTVIAETKAEAYKEFAERLKEKLWSPVETWISSDIVTEEEIDNLLKELVGEDN